VKQLLYILVESAYEVLGNNRVEGCFGNGVINEKQLISSQETSIAMLARLARKIHGENSKSQQLSFKDIQSKIFCDLGILGSLLNYY